MHEFDKQWFELMQAMYADDAKQRRKIFFDVTVLVGEIVQGGDVSSIIRLFDQIDISCIKPHYAMCLLRNTFAYQQHISNWELFRQSAIQYYERNDVKDWKALFVGLLSAPRELSDEERAMRNALHRMMKVHPSLFVS